MPAQGKLASTTLATERMKMPLTRNLYELDEVVAALRLCLRNGWGRALFWLHELIASLESTVALETLRTGWLEYGGGVDPLLITEAPEDSHGWISLAVRVLSAIRKTGSASAMYYLNRTVADPCRPHMTPLPRSDTIRNRRAALRNTFLAAVDPTEHTQEACSWAISLDAACRQGRRSDAFWLLQAAQPILSTETIWEGIRAGKRDAPSTEAISRLRDQSPVSQCVLYQAAAILFLSNPVAQREAMLVPQAPNQQVHLRDWALWNSLIGRRSARIYAIPSDALHSGTARGSLGPEFTTITELREPIAYLAEGCAFWKNALAVAAAQEDPFTGGLVFQDDADLERFVDTYFPDDIPDEWSRTDQVKSHGRGVSGIAPPPVPIRKDPVSRRAWLAGIATPDKKLTPHPLGVRPV